jgi:hypothetical protein
MRISPAIFALAILALVCDSALAQLIDFENLTPSDPYGYPMDASGTISDGYRGFAWASDPSGNPASGSPRWASLEGFFAMPGTDTAYSYGEGLSMIRNDREFDLLSLDVGSYFHTGQRVYMAGWDDKVMKYHNAFTIDATFQPCHVTPGYTSIDHFALWSGSQGYLAVPFNADHVLCIDNISYEDDTPAPVPEPSALLILGVGILGITSIYRKFRLSRNRDGR